MKLYNNFSGILCIIKVYLYIENSDENERKSVVEDECIQEEAFYIPVLKVTIKTFKKGDLLADVLVSLKNSFAFITLQCFYNV